MFILSMPPADDGGRQSKPAAGNIVCADALEVQVAGLFIKTDKKSVCIVCYFYAKVSWYHNLQT